MIDLAEDVRAADWLTFSASDFGTVHSMVPAVFEGYARVFHPASRREGPAPRLGERADASQCRDVSWAEVAEANHRTMHGAAEWGQLTGSWQLDRQECLWDSEPEEGQTPGRVALRLAAILAEHTGTPESCRFAVWEGWGETLGSATLHLFAEGTSEDEKARLIRESEDEGERLAEWGRYVREAPLFGEHGVRRYHLLHGPLSEIDRFYGPGGNAPSIWWPEDRAWCVGSDVDLMTTYLGASAGAIEAVVGDAELEALTIPAGQSVTWEADTVNPSVGPPY